MADAAMFRPMPLTLPLDRPAAFRKVVFEAQLVVSGVTTSVTMRQQVPPQQAAPRGKMPTPLEPVVKIAGPVVGVARKRAVIRAWCPRAFLVRAAVTPPPMPPLAASSSSLPGVRALSAGTGPGEG